jgi:hypothetical protein
MWLVLSSDFDPTEGINSRVEFRSHLISMCWLVVGNGLSLVGEILFQGPTKSCCWLTTNRR